LLYGVQTLEEGNDIPDFLLQTILCSSFVDYNSSDFDSYEEVTHSVNQLENAQNNQHGDNDSIDVSDKKSKPTSAEATEIALLPAPAIYKNGENVTALTDAQNEIIEVEVEVEGDSDNDTSLVTDKSQPSEPIDVPSKVNSNVNTDISDAINNDINSNDESKTINEPSLRSNYQRFT